MQLFQWLTHYCLGPVLASGEATVKTGKDVFLHFQKANFAVNSVEID